MPETNSGCDNLTYLLDDVGTLVAALKEQLADREQDVRILLAQRSLAINALEVDSEWSADHLLDAITEALAILRPRPALTTAFQQDLSSKGENA